MKIVGINGSPRKNWNTATLLNAALEGAVSQGATTEMVHLYDLKYKGCTSCFACQLKGSKNHGNCAMKDDLTSVLNSIRTADAIIMGSPIYFGLITGEMKSFLERLLFQYWSYDAEYFKNPVPRKKMRTGFIFNMGATEDQAKQMGFLQSFGFIEMALKMMFGSVETLVVTDTSQFDDYSKYETSGLNEPAKAKRRKEVFPDDCKKSFEMGVRFAQIK